MGYEELGILRPDLVLFLDVPPKISLKLNKTKTAREYLKSKKQDIAERHRHHQFTAYKSYLNEVRLNDWWVKIPCLTGGKLDSPVAIHRRIWEKVFLLLTQHQYAKRSPSILDLAGTVTPKRNRGVSVLKAREYMERHYKRI